MKRLEKDFYERPTAMVARDLLGKVLVRVDTYGRTSGMIVETEAYLGPGDPASHAHRGSTPRSSIMFGPSGFAYVYFSYGMHNLFNVVTEKDGVAGAVLVRALEPLEGVDIMLKRRGHVKKTDIASGPARLTQAMGIGLELNGFSLTGEDLFIVEEGLKVGEMVSTTRIGISDGKESLLRFYIKASSHVSKK
ncbi:MAG: DNA-3-methyladenine glycosylase [Actinomycetota bacterium]|nr:DNA-3-methyladenine glycosylase [Actinomycetota bacterium]